MNINFVNSIDSRHDIKLVGRISSAYDIEIWNNLLTSTTELFDQFNSLGGAGYSIANDKESYCCGKLEWSAGKFVYSWSSFPYSCTALYILFRMLSNILQKDEFIESVTVEGIEIDPSHPAALSYIKESILILPSRIQNLPFELQILPFSSWINIECDIAPPISSEIPSALNKTIWCWRNIAVSGGFSSLKINPIEASNDLPDMGIDGPILADDFIEWHCMMTGIPHDSLNALINMLVFFSRKVLSINAVYIG